MPTTNLPTRPARGALALAALVGAAVLAGAPASVEARPLTLRQAVELALRNDSLMEQARARLAGAVARRKQARGRMLPSLDAQGSLNYWDRALEVKFDPSSPQAVRIRDQLTTQLSLTISQPIAGQLLEAYHLTKNDQEAVAHDAAQTRIAVAFGAAEAYIRLKQASAGAAIARTAVEQVRAQLDQAQAFFRAGVIGRDDLLNVEVAQARAEAKQLRSEGLVAVARTLLLEITGWPVEVPLELAEPFGEPPTSLPCTLEGCVERALRQRADLKGVVARIGAAEAYRDLTWWNLAPQLTALGSYQNMQGQSVFMPKNAFFIGGMLNWNLWGWGRTAYEVKEADQKVVEGRSGLALLRRGVRLEVQQSHVALEVATRLLAVAKRAVAQAQEAYRIVGAKYAAQASTTKDLLDAQLALTRAELLRSNALYGWYLARAALARALGEPPPAVLAAGS